MTLTYRDRAAIEDTVKVAEERIQETLDLMQADMRRAEGNQSQMLAAFNRVAGVLETLTDEIRGLRRDLKPELDKPVKLPAPKGTTP